MEYVGPEKRTLVGNVPLAVFLTLGAASLPWIAYGLADWRLFSIVTSAPLALTVIAWWIVPESARWLVLKGRIDQTIVTLQRIAQVNGKVVDVHVYDEFRVIHSLIASSCRSSYYLSILSRMLRILQVRNAFSSQLLT
jgi:hypothetical protein